jgi:hypothetical protein
MIASAFWTSRGALGLCAGLLVLAGGKCSFAAADEAQQAARELGQRHGLVKITGRVWGLPLELQLRARLKRLPQLRERIVTAQKELDERIVRNQQAWQQHGPTIAALQARIARLSTSDPQRDALAEQLKLLSADVVEPKALAGRDEVRKQLSTLGQDRCALALDLVWIRSAVKEIAERYAKLAGDGEIARLVKQVGEKCRLGPARDYAADARKLDDYDALAFAPHVPVYLQAGRVRLTAVVCDAAAVTFTWSEDSDAASFLPASVLASAAIDVPADAPRRTVQIDGRTVECREIIVQSLRLGSCQAKSVAVCILPPEAEDLGAQLTLLALSPCRGKVEIERLRLALSE